MIKHILLFKMKEADGKTKEENAVELKKQLDALKETIKEIGVMEVGINIAKSDKAWDVSLYSEFASFEDLAVYQTHPEHVKVVDFLSTTCEDRHVVDYEV